MHSFTVSGMELFASAPVAQGAFHHTEHEVGASGVWVHDTVVEGTWWDRATKSETAYVAHLSK